MASPGESLHTPGPTKSLRATNPKNSTKGTRFSSGEGKRGFGPEKGDVAYLATRGKGSLALRKKGTLAAKGRSTSRKSGHQGENP